MVYLKPVLGTVGSVIQNGLKTLDEIYEILIRGNL